ncbi:MAG: hypoxanthine phosphoribosyltransferase [Planctomycetes bacterium]|nr:hypoxanthine phosphoribosyltransferase [Planctomycetota bacterium]
MDIRPGRILLEEARIVQRVGELAKEISDTYRGGPVTIVGVLDGCLIFLADLVRRFEMPVEIVLVRVNTYGDSDKPRKRPIIAADDLKRVSGRDVLVVDDIYDSGATLSALREALRETGAEDVKLCVLLEKERTHDRAVDLDFVGFRIPDVFVVGYGLDYAGRYRNLPCIAEIEGDDDARVIA